MYRLDPSASEVWILVDKAGPLASVGHRHVITAGALRGFALVAANGRSHADLRFPVAALSVDAPAAMARFHQDEKLSAGDRAGTRRHMLGDSVLDARRFPWIRLHVTVPHTAPGTGAALEVTIHLHGVTRTIEITGTLARDSGHWQVTGAFHISQSAFGITPYSVMLGALRVQDKLEIRYHLAFDSWRPAEKGTQTPHAQS